MIFEKIKKLLIIILGIVGVAGSVSVIYRYLLFKPAVGGIYHGFVQNFGRPAYGVLWVLYFISLLFLLNRNEKQKWRAKGIYSAFIISLFTEMFGPGLLVYMLSPFFKYPLLVDQGFYQENWLIFRAIGSYFIVFGIIFIVAGWRRVYRSGGLVTSGIYKYLRHPQYLGFIILATGLLIFWPTIVAAVLYPSLVYIYIRQAGFEDLYLEKTYGADFINYKNFTPAIIPRNIFKKT